ncbi:hypothetical protein ACHAWF_015802 [Thalassiosira exigua]
MPRQNIGNSSDSVKHNIAPYKQSQEQSVRKAICKASPPLAPTSQMEIHHRRARPSGDSNADATSVHGGGRAAPPQRAARTSGSVHAKARAALARNPYGPAASTVADVALLRSVKLLLLLAALWFFWTMAAVNAPSLDAAPVEDDEAGSAIGPAVPNLRTTRSATADPKESDRARTEIQFLRREFYERYGGEEAARGILTKGLRTFEAEPSGGAKGGAARATADRFLSAVARRETGPAASSSTKPTFVAAFGGYSVTVGRGNRLEQSYPFVLKEVLSPLLESPPFGIELIVRNSAIGGIPSFPYGWCLPNFLGDDADLVSWDYGMNEGKGAQGLEGYVRQSLMMPKSPPLFVLLDTKRPRLDLLQKYVDLGALPDPVALGRDAVDKRTLENWLKLPDEDRPAGFRKWEEWGAPKGAPGQSPWHPKKMEHELMGWTLAMHMLDALEVALDVMGEDANWRDGVLARERQRQLSMDDHVLPPPVTDVDSTGVASILHGTPHGDDKSQWSMNRISCRTSFLPNISGNLDSIVRSGVTKDDEDMLKPRDDSLFDGGWVMDVGKLERDTKLKVQKYGGLGYIDMKTALYGIPSSGTLKLWLPHEGPGGAKDDASASVRFGEVVLCEVNEKRSDKECKMTSDLSFRVAGVEVPRGSISQVKGVASYLKKDICIRMNIPEGAEISRKGGGGDDEQFGLDVEVTVTGTGVTREDGACSISHVIWENR